MIKNKSFSYYSTQWNARTCLFIGEYENMLEYLRKRFKYGGDDTRNPNHAAESFTIVCKDSMVIAYVMWMPEFSFTTGDYVSLSHEILHMTTHILDDRGVFYGDSKKETLAYSFSDFYEKYLNFLHKEYKKDGQREKI